MLKSRLCDYSNAYLLVSGTVTIGGAGADDNAKRTDERDKGVIFKNCAPYTDFKSEINNTQIDNTKYLDVVMPMYNLIEYSNNYSKASILQRYYKDDSNDNIVNSKSVRFKINVPKKTLDAGNTKDAKIAVLLKYLSIFWGTLEMSLINFEINHILAWPETCVISPADGNREFAITDTKLYVPNVTLSTQDNETLLEQLKSGFKRTITWKKYQSKVLLQEPNPHLDYSIDPSFQGVSRFFVLSFENTSDRTVNTGYYLPKVEVKD